MHKLPTYLHGIGEYGMSAVLLTAPQLLGFPGKGRANTFIRVMGAGNMVFDALTDYEWGVIPLVPMKWHKTTHYGMDAFLALSPWVLGFKDRSKRSWLPYVLMGLGGIAISAPAKKKPSLLGMLGKTTGYTARILKHYLAA